MTPRVTPAIRCHQVSPVYPANQSGIFLVSFCHFGGYLSRMEIYKIEARGMDFEFSIDDLYSGDSAKFIIIAKDNQFPSTTIETVNDGLDAKITIIGGWEAGAFLEACARLYLQIYPIRGIVLEPKTNSPDPSSSQ